MDDIDTDGKNTDEQRTDTRETEEDTAVSRRGLLASGALGLGIAGLGTAAGQDGDGGGGPPFAKKDHDHSGDYLGEDEPVSRIDVTDLSTETVNNRIEVTTDDDLATKLASAEAGDTLVLSTGNHAVDETLRRDVNGITIVGQGPTSSRIVGTGDFDVIELSGSAPFPGNARRRWWTFRDLGITTKESTGDLVSAEYSDLHRFLNVDFGGYNTTGNGIHAAGSWDWKFHACHFGQGGDPQRGTADVYAANTEKINTNNFHFTDCRWERVNSYAVYSDTSKGGGLNRRFRFAGCKFHGQPGGEFPEVYYVDGEWHNLQFVNCQFGPAHEGFIRVPGSVSRRGRGGVLIINSLFAFFHRSDSPAIDITANEVGISNNYFHTVPTDNPAVNVDGGDATVTGNSIRDAPLQVLSGTATLVGNEVQDAPGDAIRVAADGTVVDGNIVSQPANDGVHVVDAVECVVGDNRVKNGGIVSSGSSDYLAVSGNVIRNGNLSLSGDNNETAANVVR